MSAITLATDSQAIVLLCSRVGLPYDTAGPLPLSVAEWNELVVRLKGSGWRRPRALFGRTTAELREVLGVDGGLAGRITALLDRGEQAMAALKQLARRGIWVLTRVDAAYPARLKVRLGPRRPTVLFGCGPAASLSRPGIAIASSHRRDPAGETFARAFAARCAAEDVTVICGGARGAERAGMVGALEAGGRAVGVPVRGVEQALRDREVARFVHKEQLTLVASSHPAAGFSAGDAIARNTLLYCLAELAVVVSCVEGGGDAWNGAVENLEHGWAPLFTRAGASASPGNHALLRWGGVPLSADMLPPNGTLLTRLHELAAAPRPIAPIGLPEGDAFDRVWPRLESFLLEPRTEQDVAAAFGVEPRRAKAWLALAAREQRVDLLPKRPRRYRQAAPRLL